VTRAFDIAVVGTGGIAGIHAQAVAGLGGRARIVTAVDTDPDRLATFCDKWSVPRGYADLATMLEKERPDLVDLATPPALHAPQAQACLARGLTVWCEKPPALSLAELDEIAAAERAGGGRFATVFQQRFGSGAATLRGLVGAVSGAGAPTTPAGSSAGQRGGSGGDGLGGAADPRFGEPMTAVCHTLWFRPDDYFAVPWRGSFDVEGGGPTMGHGIHQIDLLLSILGDWRQVVAVATRRARATDTEDLSAALVTMESGAVVTVVNSLISPREVTYLRFDFAHATVELEHLYGYGDENWQVTAKPGHEDDVKAAWAEGPKGRSSGHGSQLAAILDALAAGEPPPVTLADTRPTMELIAAIYASAFTGAPVQRGEIGPESPFYRRMDGGGAPWEVRK
jgi:predicted dehydrogenase